MQLILLVLILPSFALIGVSGYSTYVSGDRDLVKVGDSAVTAQEFDQARSNQLQQLQSRAGASFDPALLENPAARKALLDSLVDRHVIVSVAVKEHFSVSDTVLRQTIASIPELQVDGRFSPERYSQVLAAMGVSSHDFEQGQRSDLALQRVLGPVALTASLPASVLQSIERALVAERTVRTRVFATGDYEKDIEIADADVKTWYEQNQQSLEVPEYVSAEYILLDEAAAMEGVPTPAEADLQQYYEQNKNRYVLPARVRLRHIQIDLPEGASPDERARAEKRAAAIAEKVAADKQAFADIARADSDDAGTAKDGGELGWITKGSWPEDLEKIVFALKKGDVTPAVPGPGGLHVFMADDVQPERGETFEQARSKVEAEVRRQLGADRFADMASRLTSLVYDNASSLKPAAEALGLPVRTASGIAADRLLPADEIQGEAASASDDAAILDDPRVRRALYSTQVFTDKNNSGVIEISPAEMVVVRVGQVVARHVQPLEKAAPAIRERLVAERAAQAARQAGEAVLAALRDGKSPAQPEGFGAETTVSRIDSHGLSKQVLDAAFEVPADKLPAYASVDGAEGFVLVRVERAAEGKPAAALQASLPQQLGQAWGRAEELAVLQAMKDTVGVKYLPESEEVLAGSGQERS